MYCGEYCPCCSGGMDGQNCHAMFMIYGEDWDATSVEIGGHGVRGWCDSIMAEFGHMFHWDYPGIRMEDYEGDPCHLNIVKYLPFIRDLRDKWMNEFRVDELSEQSVMLKYLYGDISNSMTFDHTSCPVTITFYAKSNSTHTMTGSPYTDYPPLDIPYDGMWHEVEIGRYREKKWIKIDGKIVYDNGGNTKVEKRRMSEADKAIRSLWMSK